MPYMRTWRWRLAITVIQQVKPELEFLLGTLAKLDERLYLLDQRHMEMAKAPSATKLKDWPSVMDALGESYLWVLGSYEAIRTLDQAFREMGAAASNRHREVNALKLKFERLRVPLAKVEAAKRHASTDYAFPKPGLSEHHGISWEVASGTWISRSELSDDFLAKMEAVQNGSLSH